MNPIWSDFIDRLAPILRGEGGTASMLNHNGLKGSARESFVKRFLGQFLPESLGIGSGEIFDRSGSRSKQIDIIVYDRTFPVIRVADGLALFPIDAVVAVIEVKSNLDAVTLVDALDNCACVTRMNIRGVRVAPTTAKAPLPTTDHDWDWIYPGTYVYGYAGYTQDPKAMATVIKDWLQKQNASQYAVPRLCLPRIVATPTCLAMRARDNMQFKAGQQNVPGAFVAVGLQQRSTNYFTADLITKVLSRNKFVRMDLEEQKQWVADASDQFSVADVDIELDGLCFVGLGPNPDATAE